MTHICQRRDTAANWTAADPILLPGEVGWEVDTRKAKLGDGETAWTALPYIVEGEVVSVNGLQGIVVLDKGDIGLGNVDNTPDSQKPISNAQQSALDAKAPLASPVFTGNPTAPTPDPGDSDTTIATTAFVTTADAAIVNDLNAVEAKVDDRDYSEQVAATSGTTPTGTTQVDVAGLTKVITSPGPTAAWWVDVSLDTEAYQATSAVIIARLSVAGAVQPQQLIFGGPNGARSTCAKRYKVTGLAAGNHTIKVTASLNMTSSGLRINTQHSVMAISRIK